MGIMAYIPLSDPVGGLGSGFSGAARDMAAIRQARQLEEQRKQDLILAQQEEARRQAEELRRQEEERATAARRPLDLAASQYALRGQLLGTVQTPEEYDAAMGEVERLGLPTADLPEARKSEAWRTFAAPKPAQVGASWIPERFRPAPMLPAPEARLPEGTMQTPGIAPEAIPQVQRAAERGLPLDKQQALQDKDIGRQIQLANLARNREKDALSAKWAEIREEGIRRNWSQARMEFEFDKWATTEKIGLEKERVEAQKEKDARDAKKPTINEGQAKAVLFGQEVSASLGDFKTLLQKGFDPTTAKGAAGVAVAGAEGLASPLRGLASQDAQIWNNAADQLAQAALRFESGAAIGEQEFGKKIRANIPRMGDSKEVVARKLQAIDRAARAFEEYSGKKFDQPNQTTSAYKFTREYNGATYGRNSPTEPWKRVK